MIKNIIVAVLLFSITSSTFAKGLEVGVKGGLNFSNYYDSSEGWKRGFCAGVFSNFEMSTVFGIRAEFIYTQKGAKHLVYIQYPTGTSMTALDYLEIPIFVKLTEPTQGMFRPYLLVGPYVAYNLAATLKWEYDGDVDEYDLDDDIKDWDYGIAIGGGFDLVMPVGKIVFDGRYTVGLTSFKEDSDIKNRAISFMLGYSLRL